MADFGQNGSGVQLPPAPESGTKLTMTKTLQLRHKSTLDSCRKSSITTETLNEPPNKMWSRIAARMEQLLCSCNHVHEAPGESFPIGSQLFVGTHSGVPPVASKHEARYHDGRIHNGLRTSRSRIARKRRYTLGRPVLHLCDEGGEGGERCRASPL